MASGIEPFSDELERWLEADGDKTLGALRDVFGERTFAVAILLLMAPAATPLPTGGVTHVFEVITILLALEMVAGRRSVWLPTAWQRRSLGPVTTGKAIPVLARMVRRCERFARPRGVAVIEQGWAWRVTGLIVGALATAAALAPPFSGLDTLPALGVVLIALAVLLNDMVLAAVGTAVGAVGTVLIVTAGAALARALRELL
jgi:hypothetical protein